ncbi:MAG: bifunctional UDP-N-acetylglucosamine diphosphorylase/glucosamine-1-phosphate N-acetyltransferase GlmU [Gammaproteobacteria bacterium]|jgi:bifunctional UDP-N-acetylglucosamine pyrophosphorylase/glucosamine-1-phosphate N-acetyltransferase
MNLTVCILAAGQGKRMHSDRPKVLHEIGGKSLVGHVIDTARTLSAHDPIVVFGHGGDQLQAAFTGTPITWIEQRVQLGTGHAVGEALEAIPHDGMTLILYGDVPLLRAETLERLISKAADGSFGLLTANLDEPAGYGRIVRDAGGNVCRIVEHKDANTEELAIREINTGIMAINSADLHRWIPALGNSNAQGEYYLTDCVAAAVADGTNIVSVLADSEAEVTGVNNRLQLATLERRFQRDRADELMERGVMLRDPDRFDVRGSLQCGRDVEIDINAVFIGDVTLGDRVRVGPNCVIENAVIGDDVEILPNCVIESAGIGDGSRIGPFARVRPETVLGRSVHVGNFVEVKKSHIRDGSKVNHLSYVGDSDIGKNVNVGAGTITCNYDGAYKHKTVIEDDVFIGSDTQLVAPVTIGRGATVGAGTTVTDDVGTDELVISRVKQKTISGWKRPRKDKLR